MSDYRASHIMCIGWPTIKRLAAGEAVWFEDLQCGAVAADDLHGAPIDAMLERQKRAWSNAKADLEQERTIDSVPSCGQENDYRKTTSQVSKAIEIAQQMEQWARDFSTDEDHEVFLGWAQAVRQAADEIERLNAELVDKAKAWDAIAEKNAEIERLRAELATSQELCTRFEAVVGEDVGEMLKLRAEVDTLKTALTAPTKEEIALRTELKAAEYAAKTNWEGWQQEIERAKAAETKLATDLNDALSHLRAGIEKLRHTSVEIPIELHKACHALTHIVAALTDEEVTAG